MNKILYRGWIILPTALPTTDGQWTASCDLARMEADGLEVFEGLTLQFVRAIRPMPSVLPVMKRAGRWIIFWPIR